MPCRHATDQVDWDRPPTSNWSNQSWTTLSACSFAKISRDLTASREANLAALGGERRFRLLVQGASDYAIYMLDPQGRVTNWNTGAERIKGYSSEEIVGEHFSRFYTPEDVEARIPWKAIETAKREGRFDSSA